MKISAYRKEWFNAAHRLHNAKWSDERNTEVFGKCNNPSYHGHNYELLVKLYGEVDPETGYLMDLKILKDIIRNNVIDRLDHKNLNIDVPEFKQLNPTAENIAKVIWDILREKIDHKFELTVILYETERNFVEYAGQ
jgi:6-pyruvoyltetrahydropterin/6-carboxytetrahydropterin synthase